MVRAIAKQAEAERLRRAKVINAMGEQQAAEKLVEAGRILAQEPQAMQLRYFAASARHRGRAVVDRRVSAANRPARSFDAFFFVCRGARTR